MTRTREAQTNNCLLPSIPQEWKTLAKIKRKRRGKKPDEKIKQKNIWMNDYSHDYAWFVAASQLSTHVRECPSRRGKVLRNCISFFVKKFWRLAETRTVPSWHHEISFHNLEARNYGSHRNRFCDRLCNCFLFYLVFHLFFKVLSSHVFSFPMRWKEINSC